MLVHIRMDFDPKVPMVRILGLVHLWVQFTGFVFGGTGSGGQPGINDHDLLHGHAPPLEMGLDCFKNLLAEVVLLRQVTQAEDRCLIRDLVADQFDSCKATLGMHAPQSVRLP